MKKTYNTPKTTIADFAMENLLIQVGSDTNSLGSVTADSNIRGTRTRNSLFDELIDEE